MNQFVTDASPDDVRTLLFLSVKPQSAPVEHITQSIFVLRGQKALLDAELAALYGVTTARLNQQIRRNRQRFPADFLFELTAGEFSALMLQNATSKAGRGGRRKLPFAFTEHGAIMAIRALMSSAPAKRRPIGFTANFGG